MKGFYCFKNMNHVVQPYNSYWCWAACLSKMISGLKAKSKIGVKQCELVGYYKDNRNDLKRFPRKSIDCCSKVITSECNISLFENDLEHVFSHSGFAAYEMKIEELDSFENVKNLLTFNQSPIVLKTQNNGSAHMVLINGFGEKNSCQYILISDPIGSAGEKYIEFELFKNTTEIDRLWKTMLKIPDNLIVDKLLEKSYEYVNKFIKQEIENNQYDIKLQNVWAYLTHHNPSYIAKQINDINHEKDNRGFTYNKMKQDFINNLENDFKNSREEICKPYVNRKLITLRDINLISEEDLNSGDFKLTGKDFCNIKDYATRLEVRKSDSRIEVRPIAYPKNYTLNEGWQEFSSFITTLKKPENPKISFFNNKGMDSPPPSVEKLTI